MFPSRRLLALGVKAAVAIVVVALLWSVVGPVYDSLLVGFSNVLSPSELALVDGHHIVLYSHAGSVEGIDSLVLHSGLILVFALVVVTPGLGIWRRLWLTAIACVLVFAVHVLTILALAGHMIAGDDPVVILLLPVGGSLFPAVIWGALCLGWLHRHRYPKRSRKGVRPQPHTP